MIPAIIGALGRGLGGAGRAAGSLLGGPPGMNPNAGKSGMPVGAPLGTKTQQAVQGFQAAANAITGASFAAQALAGGVGAMGKAVGVALSPIETGVGMLGKFRDSMASMGTAVGEFVKLANPVEVQKFNLALDDLTAGFGKILLPVMEFATKQMRGVADVVWALTDPFQKLMSAIFKPMGGIIDALVDASTPLVRYLGKLVDVFTELIKPSWILLEAFTKLAASGFATVFELWADGMTPFLDVAQAVAMVFTDIAKAMAKFMAEVGDLLGLKKLGGPDSIRGKSVGAAVRPATFSSVEEYGKKAQQAAFSLGTAADPAVTTSKSVLAIYEYLTTILPAFMKYLENMPLMLAELAWRQMPPEIKAAITFPMKVKESVAGEGSGIAGGIEKSKAGGVRVEERSTSGGADPLGIALGLGRLALDRSRRRGG